MKMLLIPQRQYFHSHFLSKMYICFTCRVSNNICVYVFSTYFRTGGIPEAEEKWKQSAVNLMHVTISRAQQQTKNIFFTASFRWVHGVLLRVHRCALLKILLSK